MKEYPRIRPLDPAPRTSERLSVAVLGMGLAFFGSIVAGISFM